MIRLYAVTMKRTCCSEERPKRRPDLTLLVSARSAKEAEITALIQAEVGTHDVAEVLSIVERATPR